MVRRAFIKVFQRLKNKIGIIHFNRRSKYLIQIALVIFLTFSMILAVLAGFTIKTRNFSINPQENVTNHIETTASQSIIRETMEWKKTFGGIADDCGYWIEQSSDGGYIIVGSTESYGAGYEDVWLIKTDENGNKEWDNIYGGKDDDRGLCVKQTIDGGYVITGLTYSYSTGEWDCDVWLIKTDENGNEEWNKIFGGTGFDYGQCVAQISNEGYIIAGYTDSYGAGDNDVWLIKTNEEGNKIWNKTYGGAKWDRGFSVQQTMDGGYIIAGETESYGAGWEDVWLIKTDENGEHEWNQTFGGTYNDGAFCIEKTSDGGYIMSGYKTPNYSLIKSDVFVIKTDENGNEEWSKTFGGSELDIGLCIKQITDGGYIITGFTRYFSPEQYDNILLIKIDENGNEKWKKEFDKGTGRCVLETNDNYFLIAGSTNTFISFEDSDVFLIKTSKDEDGILNNSLVIYIAIGAFSGLITVLFAIYLIHRKQPSYEDLEK